MKTLLCGLCFLSAATLLGCSSSQADWNTANTQGNVAAYQAFLSKHPNDPHDADAQQRIQTLQDSQAWMTAQTANTLQSYQQYLASEPSGAHAADARNQITSLQRAADWQTAKAAGTSGAVQDFLQKYPTGSEADEARAQLAQFDYQVQLGTYSSSQSADKARSRLQDKYGKDLHAVVIVPPAGKSKTYHVASAAMTQDQAKSACDSLKKQHQRCEVMKAQSPGQG
jgi:outer membrane protein assembly factor BamD (BamD/ComL family)